MSASVLSALEMVGLTENLPSLICETDIEKQLMNIQNCLKPVFPLDAIGVLMSDNGSGIGTAHAHNLAEDMLKGAGKQLAESAGKDWMFVSLGNDGAVRPGAAGDLDSGGLKGLTVRLKHQGDTFGTLLMVTQKDVQDDLDSDDMRLQGFFSVLSSLIYNTYTHHQKAEKMRLFNLYETVSSALCYAGDLQELLMTIISIVVSELPSEGGSILLYDDETNELEFFSVMGGAEDSLFNCRFPADKGIAGQAFQEGVPVIVSDVQASPNFFSDFDKNSGFVTQSILAAPVVSGGEKVGVIEAINKVGAASFDESDKSVLMAIADEVGLAIKNARMFDYVVDSYCKIRQGLMSCKGCVRPLKSWTPCARQLDVL